MSAVARDGFAFVIDTDHYAGDFERETCAAATGRVGECGVGVAVADAARADLSTSEDGRRFLRWCEDHVRDVADDNGCARPCSAYPTPGWMDDGHGNAYRVEEKASPAIVARYLASVRSYFEPRAAQADERAEEEREKGNASEAKAWEREARGHRRSIVDAEKRGPEHCAAYQSVAIWLDCRPPAWVVEMMKARAAAFLAKPGKGRGAVPVTGFRVMRMGRTAKEVES
ncbi:hypothetical protein K0U83_10820 [bacterium]|nr:hypothetical protein [bacterium]